MTSVAAPADRIASTIVVLIVAYAAAYDIWSLLECLLARCVAQWVTTGSTGMALGRHNFSTNIGGLVESLRKIVSRLCSVSGLAIHYRSIPYDISFFATV